jgi:hypothetical protein
MSSWDSPIIRVSTGLLNTVNDALIGGVSGGASGFSKFSGQLGKTLWVPPDQISLLHDSSVGTLYGGRFRYVRMRSADDDSPALTPGKLLFWDTTITNWQSSYQVTRDEDLSSVDNAVMLAGVYLGGFEPGNYGFIQDLGMVPVRFRSVLTTAGAIGSRVYAAGAGDTGDDQGTADVLTSDATSLAHARFLGRAPTAPSGGSLTAVLLDFTNVLGVG